MNVSLPLATMYVTESFLLCIFQVAGKTIFKDMLLPLSPRGRLPLDVASII